MTEGRVPLWFWVVSLIVLAGLGAVTALLELKAGWAVLQ